MRWCSVMGPSAAPREATVRMTLQLVAEHGAEQENLDPFFAASAADDVGFLDAAQDVPNMPLEQEPPSLVRDMEKRGSPVMRHA